jgi:Tfp pilus assembly protein PilO
MNAPGLVRRVFEERRRVLLPLVVVLVANVAILVLAVLPLRSAVSSAEAEAARTMQELGDARRLQTQVTRARASKQDADEELRLFYGSVLPRDLPTAQKTINLWVNEAARAAGLEFRGSQFDWDEVRDSPLTRAFSRVTLQGTYPDIRQFLHAVEAAEEFVVVERVELVQQADEISASGALEVSLVVATYFLTKPAA